jgi:ribosomal protein S6 modification protein
LPRFGTTSTQMGCSVLQHFEGKETFCLNSSQAFLNARDKWKSLQLLLNAGVPVPNSLLSGGEVQAQATVSHISSPTILKTLNGSQGIGVILAEKPQSAVSIMEAFKQTNISMLQQDFIEEAGNADIRCFVMGDQVVATMQRIGQDGEFRANCHRGGKTEKIILSDEEKQIAIQATKAIGLDVAGVDLIRSKNGLLVLEVNASPGLEMIEKTSGVDIALQMINYVEKQIHLNKKNK